MTPATLGAALLVLMQTKDPLAGLPGPEGPAAQKVRALGDHGWINLGSPAADPRWGKARGRSWSSRMAYAPNLRIAFTFGEGVHGWWNRENNRNMDDLWAYDIHGHRWICLYPGTDVKNIDLHLDADGFEADKDGHRIPVTQLGHGYELVTFDTDLARFMFMPGNSAEWQGGPFGERRKVWLGITGSQDVLRLRGMPTHNSPWGFDVRTGQWSIRKVQGPWPSSHLGDLLVYVPTMKKAFFWRGGEKGIWLYDAAANTWTAVQPQGPPPPFGIEPVACLDTQRGRIYLGGGRYPQSKTHGFWCYDLKSNAWIDLQPKGAPCGGSTFFSTNLAAMNYDSSNDVVVLTYHVNHEGIKKGQGLYIYDPSKNTWTDNPQPFPGEFLRPNDCLHSFYSPEFNAHFYHLAGDSTDNGLMWAYRHGAGRVQPLRK